MISGVVGLGRSMAQRLMTETVRVGVETETVSTVTLNTQRSLQVSYSGAARVIIRGTVLPDERIRLSQTADFTRAVISFPMSATVTPGMIVIVDASTVDGQLIGRRYRLIGEGASGQVTARRFDAEVLDA